MHAKHAILLYCLVFISSFLLFQLELIVGKIFLPNFGGSYLVWGACMVFFQFILLIGYSLAYQLYDKFGLKTTQLTYLSLLILSLLFFPYHKIELVFAAVESAIVISVFWKLIKTIGIAFLALSMTSVIGQYWLHRIGASSASVYRLFVISNAGSFVGLICYPVLTEAFMDLDLQQSYWEYLYYILGILFILSLFYLKPNKTIEKKLSSDTTTANYKLRWIMYSAVGVMAFLAVNNIITAQIAPMPLLWVAPLSIYLLSFVYSFAGKMGSYQLEKYLPWTLTLGFSYYFFNNAHLFPAVFDVIIYLVVLWIMVLYIHLKLYENRPLPGQLGVFYSFIGIGSFAGGLFTTWILPLISVNFMEYYLSLICLVIISSDRIQFPKKLTKYLLPVAYLSVYLMIPKISMEYKLWFGIAIFGALSFHFSHWRKQPSLILMTVCLLTIFSTRIESNWEGRRYTLKKRNYYGTTGIFQNSKTKFLVHNHTIHGGQILADQEGQVPLTYYHPLSPSAQLIQELNEESKVGIIGLGVGALAAYGKEGQKMDFYEIDPAMKEIAYTEFPFLSNCRAEVDIILGDARKELMKVGTRYDLLIVDAFNGGAVPTHFLTREALRLYDKHLTEGGILVMHLTNRYVNLKQVFANVVDFNSYNCYYQLDNKSGSELFKSEWMALTKKNNSFAELQKMGWIPVNRNRSMPEKMWTDGYSYLLPYIELKNLF